MQIDSDFPGGNIIVDSIEGDVARLHQDNRDTIGDWFYWHFRVRDVAGRTIRFEFPNDLFTAKGPCMSFDGRNWTWLGREVLENHSFSFQFPAERDEAFFSMGIPYLQADLEQFLQTRPDIQRSILTQSDGGRDVELVHLPARKSVRAVLLTARTHACEAVVNFVMEGIVDFWREDSFLKEKIDLWAVPFVDKDGVEVGDQGKNRNPHDHNRDYSDSPIYAVTRAIQKLMADHREEWLLCFDLHCPWIRGENNEDIYLVGPRAPWDERVIAFAKIIEETQVGELQFRPGGVLKHGTAWNTGVNPTLTNYMITACPRCEFATTIEVPYGVASGVTVTVERARELGRDLARAVKRHASSRGI